MGLTEPMKKVLRLSKKENKKSMEIESDSEDNTDDGFVMVPQYKISDRKPPRGNVQLETGLDRLKDYLFDPANQT